MPLLLTATDPAYTIGRVVGITVLVLFILLVFGVIGRGERRLCPRCGETVRRGRLDCAACGFDFRTVGQPANPPAWHPDPEGKARLRYWDGQRWTDDTAA